MTRHHRTHRPPSIGARHHRFGRFAPLPIAVLCSAALLGGCGESSRLPDKADVGPRPTLVPPNATLLPTVNIAPAVGWRSGALPTAAAGLQVVPFASGLDHPRWVYVLPNGDVLVAETNAPPRPDEGKGIKAFFMQLTMKKAGAGVPSANRITLLRDADGDGQAETRSVFLEGLNSPLGMALVGDKLYVANTDGVVEFPYTRGATHITAPARQVAALPAGTRNHHWTKNIIASADGSKLYATVGSNSNVAENGMAVEENRAAVLEITLATGATRLFASGIRNPNGMAWEPTTGALWVVANERDEIGSDLVPDYLSSVREGAFYGWPYSYYGQHVDDRVSPQRPELVARAIAPDYALGAHVAALGLVASGTSTLPAVLSGGTAPAATAPVPAASTASSATSLASMASPTGTVRPAGMFIGMHGSWNRKPHSGYKVVYVPFQGGQPSGTPVDVLTGFVNADGDAQGRPVGVAVDSRGALLVADDVGNAIWRVTPK